MKYYPEIERNFSKIKNKLLINKDTDERIVIKHIVYYEGTKQIKIELVNPDGIQRVEIIEEHKFPAFVGSLKLVS